MSRQRYFFLFTAFLIIVLMGVQFDKEAQMQYDKRHKNSSALSAYLDILGEMRYTAAAMLWIKADQYHHEYESTRRPNAAIMPIIRWVTILDPTFVQAYDTGAYFLLKELNRKEEAFNFLKEGIRNNPDSFDLNWEFGYLLTTENQYGEALPYLIQAHQKRDNSTAVYDEYMRINWVNRTIVRCYMELDELPKAIPYIEEIIGSSGNVNNKAWQELLEKAKNTTQ